MAEKENGIRYYFLMSFIPMWALSCLYYFQRDDRILLSMMLLPAAASVIARLITREGFSQMMLRPHFKGNRKRYFSAYFAPPLDLSMINGGLANLFKAAAWTSMAQSRNMRISYRYMRYYGML